MNAIDKIKEVSKNMLPWLVVGKGPSFDPFFKGFRDYNVLSINGSIEKASIYFGLYCVVFNDYNGTKEIDLKRPTAIFCSKFMPRYEDGHARFDNLVRMSQNLAGVNLEKVFYFNFNHARIQDPTIGVKIHAYNSTYETAIWLLAHAGCRQVYTMGIDFSKEYHEAFNRPWADIGFNAVKYYAQLPIDYFKMQVTRIGERKS